MEAAELATAEPAGNYPTSPVGSTGSPFTTGPGKLTANQVDLELTPSRPAAEPEELPLPKALTADDSLGQHPASSTPALATPEPPQQAAPQLPADSEQAPEPSGSGEMHDPYFSKTRTFSLDYSVEALGGDALAEVELWGTEDGGRTWQKWGTDPDRRSPFDVRVGNDGLFGFRTVIVGRDGQVLGQPSPGAPADVWIQVDTQAPRCQITRAVYGEGSESGMLVIDYRCQDDELAELPISLAYSEQPEGPWTTIAAGQRNS